MTPIERTARIHILIELLQTTSDSHDTLEASGELKRLIEEETQESETHVEFVVAYYDDRMQEWESDNNFDTLEEARAYAAWSLAFEHANPRKYPPHKRQIIRRVVTEMTVETIS